MIFEELLMDESDDSLSLDEIVDDFDWDDDTLLSLDEEMAAQGGFDPGKSCLGDCWSVDTVG